MELYLSKTQVSYLDARENCEAMKSDLVEIWDAHEFEEVKIATWNKFLLTK